MSRRSIAIVIFATLLLSGCNADTETIISSSDIGDTISTSTAVSIQEQVGQQIESGVEDWDWESEEVTVPGDVEFEIDEDNQIQGVTSTTTVTITPDIEVEDTDIEVGVFDEDDIKTDVNAGVSNEYGKVGNYTNTSYNEEWGRLGAADPLAKTTYFSDSQFDDLMKFVKSGYLPCSTNGNMIKDPRIASRAGGIDNPRRPWWTDADDVSDFSSYSESDACWLVVTKDAKITQDVVAIIEDDNSSKDYTKALESFYGSDMCPGMEVTYGARNYCGDIIRMHVGGNEVNWSGKTYTYGELSLDGSSIPGIDYTVVCKEDPSAIRLLTAEESKSYVVSGAKGGGVVVQNSMNKDGVEKISEWGSAGLGSIKALDTAELATDAFYDTNDNLITAGYVAEKPGIFTLTVTSTKTGESMDIVIENLPVHYKELQWGCRTQREMDCVVGYYLNNYNNGMFAGKFDGASSLWGIDGMGLTVDYWNKEGIKDINGNIVNLKQTEAAEEFLKYMPKDGQYKAIAYGGGLNYNAYEYLMYGQGDCDSVTSDAQAGFTIGGITNRFVGSATHGWMEFLVPASISEDGQDHWVTVNNGNLGNNKDTATWRRDAIEGWNYWK